MVDDLRNLSCTYREVLFWSIVGCGASGAHPSRSALHDPGAVFGDLGSFVS